MTVPTFLSAVLRHHIGHFGKIPRVQQYKDMPFELPVAVEWTAGWSVNIWMLWSRVT